MTQLLAGDGVLRRVIEAASAAPSFHNTQPWHFTLADDGLLEVRADPDRALWVADPHGRALHLSCGAALFNIRMAIRMQGFTPLIWPLPQPNFPAMVLAVVQAEPGRPPSLGDREMYQAIWRRHTDRGPYSTDPVPEYVRRVLEQAAGYEFTSLRSLNARDTATVLALASRAGAELAGDIDHQIELQDWVATGSRDDGIPATALPAQASRHPAPVRNGDLTAAAPGIPRQAGDYEQFPHLAVLTTARDEPADWLRAGQALQRILLTATVRGLSASFLYQPIELADMRGAGAPAWPWRENPQMIIRLGYGRGSAGAPRRPVDQVLSRVEERAG